MRFGICASVSAVKDWDTINFDYLEVSVQNFLVPEQPESVFAENLSEAQTLQVPIEAANILFPGDMTLIETTEQKVDYTRIEQYLKVTFQRAARAGIRVIVFGSGKVRACPVGYEQTLALKQVADHLAHWGSWAQAHNVTLVLEPLRKDETNLINTLAEGGKLVTQVGQSHIKLLADTYHMACNVEAPQSIESWGAVLSHIHVAEKKDRAAPGTYGEDLRPYFRALRQIGYDQRISIECRWNDMRTEANLAIGELKRQWEESNG